MTTIAWFHPFSGIAGDMALASLLDAGADRHAVLAALVALPAPEGITVETVQRCGIGATRVVVPDEPDHHHRPYASVRALLDAAELPGRVHERAAAVFERLAVVEGRIHGVEPDDVEFHEVGSLDAIVDVVGTCAALEDLGVDEVRSAPVAVGTGTVRGSHGILPNPAPAVVALLAMAGAPSHGVDVPMELTTPTGAALLAALASGFGPMPAMTAHAVGYGAGTRDLDGRPNVVQVVIGTAAPAPSIASPGQPVRLLEVNVDDTTGEVLAHAVSALLAAGAHDAWITPIVMKKGRPAFTVSVLADPVLAPELAARLCAETGSLGVRGRTIERWPRAREEGVVDVDGVPVRIKIGAGRVKVEHDDAVAAARRLDLPLREVMARAEAAADRIR
jgi:pyridinium-3,5-bisthiocarboxylic acid mononucleotide nickel chelatase